MGFGVGVGYASYHNLHLVEQAVLKGAPGVPGIPGRKGLKGETVKLCVAILYDVAIVVLQYMVFALR